MNRYVGTTLYVRLDHFCGRFVVKNAIFILKMCHYSCNLYVCFYETKEYSHVLLITDNHQDISGWCALSNEDLADPERRPPGAAQP